MTKKYKSRSSLLRIAVCVNGKLQDIEFAKSNLGYGLMGSAYITNDKEIQKALEKHEYFNRNLTPSFWTDDVEPEEQIVAVESVEVPAESAPIKRGRKPKAE